MNNKHKLQKKHLDEFYTFTEKNWNLYDFRSDPDPESGSADPDPHQHEADPKN